MKKIKDYNHYVNDLKKSSTEEDVKSAYARHFDITYDTSYKHDLYTPTLLFEFKYNKNLENLNSRSTILAQTLYYIHRLKYGISKKPIPKMICIADKNEALLLETNSWRKFYTDVKEKYDWDLAPSSPDINLVKDVSEISAIREVHVYKVQNKNDYKIFYKIVNELLNVQLSLDLTDKKIITEDNFEEIYEYWNQMFGESVRNGLKTSRYFVCDIQLGKTKYERDESKVYFIFNSNDIKLKKIIAKDYDYFWNLYEKVKNQDIIRGIIAKSDRLTDETLRRFYGEFFTPLKFAKKGLEYIERTVGKKWWSTGKYRIWDMAAGTGNLEYHLPGEALQYTYLSTLYSEDMEHLNKLFPKAEIFQYDYLNDDISNLYAEGQLPFGMSWKLPEKLRNDLNNPKIKWIILINPPFATSQTAGALGKSKKDVSDTNIRKVMHSENLGEVSRELFAQFLFRIKQEFTGKVAHLGLFSKLKYINAPNDQKFRDTVFQFCFERGFIFSSVNFAGTSPNSQFPVGFIVWDLSKKKKIEKQNIELDVFNVDVEKIAKKKIFVEHKSKFLSNWIERPNGIKIFPPLSSSIKIQKNNIDARDRISEGFLASLMCKGNDLQNQNYTALLSAPYVSAGAFSITPEIFENSMVIHAIRRLPKADWINDRDQYMQPNKKLANEFITDCVIWSLFSKSNETVSMRNVEYKKKIYQIDNHFFPFMKSVIKKWKISESDISDTLVSGEDSFVSEWIENHSFTTEAKAILDIGKEVYKYFFANLNVIDTTKYKIQSWDVGWWQIRSALKDQNLGIDLLEELKNRHDLLKEKLLPQVYIYGFLS